MSLSNFQEHFSNTYEEIFLKTLVAMKITNMRFEKTLRSGESIERVRYDIDNVIPRPVTRGQASTIDRLSDSVNLLVVNEEYETAFHLSDGEITQAGPLNPGAIIGAKVAHKLSQHLDGQIFKEVRNAANTFDEGDLTGALTSSGTAISLNSTTVPQMVSRMPAKLMNKENIDATTNMVLVVDALAAADMAHYLLGKEIDLAGAVFRNGYSGMVHNAEMYISENLMSEAVIRLPSNFAGNDSITINGVTFRFTGTPSGAGQVDIASGVNGSRANLTNAINNADTGQNSATGYFSVSDEDLSTLKRNNIVAVNDNSAGTITITSCGRLAISVDFTSPNNAVDSNVLHAYYGKRGAIDLVLQDIKEMDMRITDDRRGYNIFSSYLAGYKTFTDGSKQFLDVHINNS